MFRLQHLKILYVLLGVIFAGYWSENLVAFHLREHTPLSTGAILCLLLFVAVPTLGYGLLFKLFPLAGRFLRR
jgi:hypothetical protein